MTQTLIDHLQAGRICSAVTLIDEAGTVALGYDTCDAIGDAQIDALRRHGIVVDTSDTTEVVFCARPPKRPSLPSTAACTGCGGAWWRRSICRAGRPSD